MSPIVKCDICGGIYNQSHLSSHKRLAHGKGEMPIRAIEDEAGNLEAIVSMYQELPEERKKEVLRRLASAHDALRKT